MSKAKTKKTDFEDIVEVVEDTLEAQEEEVVVRPQDPASAALSGRGERCELRQVTPRRDGGGRPIERDARGAAGGGDSFLSWRIAGG